MSISLIVARSRNGAIGRGNEIPWSIPEDLAFFQRETMGGAIIMGRRTWESLPVRPLKGRANYVVSSGNVGADLCFSSPQDAVAHAYSNSHRRIYGIGGAAIYQALLPIADRLLVTEVDLQIEDADTFFPEFDPGDWRVAGRHIVRYADPECELVEYLR